jgi:hypothetical protein
MATAKDIDLGRLRRAVRQSRKALEPYRKHRLDAVRQYAGGRWSDEAARKKVPVNLIATYVTTALRSLVAQNPRAMLSTFNKDARPTVSAMEAWANEQIERIHLDDTLRESVTDALFRVGIVKVALATPADALALGWGLAAGTPFAECIDFDDFVYDANARKLSAAAFLGHRYRAPLAAVRSFREFDRRARQKVTATEYRRHNEDGDERVPAIGRSDTGAHEELDEYVDLYEIYLPRHRCVVTLTFDEEADDSEGPLRYQDWLGPEGGPYHFLSFAVVPGNPLGKAPVDDLYDLHMLVNDIYRKLTRQAERQKQVGVVQRSGSEDGSRVVQAGDGEMIGVDNVQGTTVLNFGGIDPGNAQFGIHARDLFSRQAGNLDLMAGSGPQSKTATQDKLLNENASMTLADMQAATLKHTSRVIGALCWYWHHDPRTVMRTEYSVPGMPEVSTERAVSPGMRQQIPWEELKVKVDPYSMQHSTPQGKATLLLQAVKEVYVPLAGVAAQQGIMLDLNDLLSKLGKLWDIPDLTEVLTVMPPPQPQGGGGGTGMEAGGMPSSTERHYTRHGTGGDSQGGRENDFSNMMSAGAAQGGQAPQGGGY